MKSESVGGDRSFYLSLILTQSGGDGKIKTSDSKCNRSFLCFPLVLLSRKRRVSTHGCRLQSIHSNMSWINMKYLHDVQYLLLFHHTRQNNPMYLTVSKRLVISLWITNIHYHSWRTPAVVLMQSSCATDVCLYATCNMVTTCLSPAFVQIGAIPNFTATRPTRRLPGQRKRGKDDLSASEQREDSWRTQRSRIMTSTICPIMTLPGFIFEWVELISGLSPVFLSHALSHVLLVVLCEMFIKPRCGVYCPSATHDMGRTARRTTIRESGPVIFQ